MRMTNENKGWMRSALQLGEDNMILFSEKCWHWISDSWINTPLHEQCNFYQKYVEFGGEDNLAYDNEEALEKTIEYAHDKIMDCFSEIDRRLNLTEE
tara:strand:+ start:312 stop:602 length:291 start_codon:yes stop_codon:yes gene_type:complete